MLPERVYLDHNATTALAPEVWEAMRVDVGTPNNPSSPHSWGRAARQKLLEARELIANFLKVDSPELLFNSGGTEGLNFLVQHAIAQRPGGHIITTCAEHAALDEPLRHWAAQGGRVTFLPIQRSGHFAIEALEEAILPDTHALFLSAAHGETGVKLPLSKVARLAEKKELFFAVDGVALMGKELFGIPHGVSAMAFSGHKFHGPKGIGSLFLRKGIRWSPLHRGGPQESGRRAGTENLGGIVGLGAAVGLLPRYLPAASEQMRELRDLFESELLKAFPDLLINGAEPRIPNTSNLCFPGVDGETLLLALDQCGIGASLGSACSSGALEPSKTLLAMGLSRKEARSSLRFSLGRHTTRAEIDYALERLIPLVRRLQEG